MTMKIHRPGCGAVRNRPCICTYLDSWVPRYIKAPIQVISLDRLLDLDDFYSKPFRLPGTLVPRKPALTFTGRDGRKIPVLTPQLRDQIRRGALEKSLSDSYTITEEGAVLSVSYPKPEPHEPETSLSRRIHKSDVLALNDEMRHQMWRADFWKQIAAGMAFVAAVGWVASVGYAAGWW